MYNISSYLCIILILNRFHAMFSNPCELSGNTIEKKKKSGIKANRVGKYD